MLTHANIIDEIESRLQDSTNTYFSTTELGYLVTELLKEISRSSPREVIEKFFIESRTGTATETTTDHLVDDTEEQFLAADATNGKLVYNETDNTWAVVTAYTDAGDLTLNKDIMASGENYKIFNKNCFSNKEINIENIVSYLAVERAEYPTMENPPAYRNFTLNGDILRLAIDFEPDDSKVATSGEQPDTEVNIYFLKPHFVSELTDLSGAVNYGAGYAAGTTSIAVDGLQTSGTIKADQEFVIAGCRGTYRVTTDATISTSAATITFWPGLDSAIANEDVVTFTGSTLSPELEGILINYVAAQAALSKSLYFMNRVNIASNTGQNYLVWANKLLEETKLKLRKLRGVSQSLIYPTS